jgi:hypothetical protein
MSSSIEQLVNDIIRKQQVKDSQGIVFLKNGAFFHFTAYFDGVRSIWLAYREALTSEDYDELQNIIKNFTTGGVISNGEVDILLSEIASMMKADENMFEDQDEMDIN